MPSGRQVELVATCRTVSGFAELDAEVVRYSGITVVRLEGGEAVEHTWVPLGTAPSFADDEALIDAWRAAVAWCRDHTRADP